MDDGLYAGARHIDASVVRWLPCVSSVCADCNTRITRVTDSTDSRMIDYRIRETIAPPAPSIGK